MTLRWIATALHMGSWQYVSHLLYLRRRKTTFGCKRDLGRGVQLQPRKMDD
jgi:hypothetical protein